MDTTLHSAFRDARTETRLPSAPNLPLNSAKRRTDGQAPESVPSIITPNDTWLEPRDSISSIITTSSTRRDSISSSSIELQHSRPVLAYRRIGYRSTLVHSPREYCM